MPAKQALSSEPVTKKTLEGRTVLVTRSPERAEQFVQQLESLGAAIILFPTVETSPPDSWNECDSCISSLNNYDYTVFTSANAAHYFLGRAKSFDAKLSTFRKKTVFVVGEETRRAIESFGLAAITFDEAHNAKKLGEALRRVDVKNKRILFPKGNLASGDLTSILRKSGAVVDEIVTYLTRLPPGTNAESARKLFSQNRIDVITFFSPSSVHNLLSVLPKEFLSTATIAAIGGTTAEAARDAFLTVKIVADRPTADQLAAAIARFYE